MHRIRSAVNSFNTARQFGRGRIFSAWLAARWIVMGSTGKYRIAPIESWGKPTRPAPPMPACKPMREELDERSRKILFMNKAGMSDDAILRELAQQGDVAAREYVKTMSDLAPSGFR